MSSREPRGEPPCRRLEWDSAFFGFQIASVRSTELDELVVGEIDAWSRANQIALVYLEASIDDPVTVRLAERHEFGLVDVRVVLDRPLSRDLPHLPTLIEMSPAIAGDLPALIRMSRTAFGDSRFYFDPRIPDERCHALYERWVEESFRGYADRVIVARQADDPEGFITCHLDDGGKTGRIGLIAVDDRSRGRGVGEALVAAALTWFASQGAEVASVATQARNIDGQRLYAKLGFRVRRTSLYYHKWYASHT